MTPASLWLPGPRSESLKPLVPGLSLCPPHTAPSLEGGTQGKGPCGLSGAREKAAWVRVAGQKAEAKVTNDVTFQM